MSERAPRALLFDSGMGGLSIARSIWHHLPGMRLVYVADNLGFPYGDQPEEEVVRRCVSLVDQTLAQYPCDLVVVACNTASTVVLPALRERLKVPVVGVVPAIKPAAAMTRNKRLGLLATPATVRRPYLDKLIHDYASDCTITRVGSSELVRLAENSLETGRVATEAITPILAPLVDGNVDTIVLGCTHFPLINASLREALPGTVTLVDSGEAIARRVEQLLGASSARDEGLGIRGGLDAVLTTGQEPAGLGAWMIRSGIAESGAAAPQITRVSLNIAKNSSIGIAGR